MTATIHQFQQSLDLSHAYTDAPWWPYLYRRMFPEMTAMISLKDDCAAQRAGVDRKIILRNNKTLDIDEKVRGIWYGWDVLLEFEHRWLRGDNFKAVGWIEKADMLCDFIAYAWVPRRCALLLPFVPLQRAWKDNREEWLAKAEKRQSGFFLSRAHNPDYVTLGCCVPCEVLREEITHAMRFSWPASLA